MIPPPLLCRCFDIVRVVFLFLLPLGKFTLAFLTLVIRQNIGEETSGDRLDFVVRDLGVIDHLFPPGHRRHLLMEDCGSSAILQYAKEALAIRGRLFRAADKKTGSDLDCSVCSSFQHHNRCAGLRCWFLACDQTLLERLYHVRTNCAPFRPPAEPGDIHSAPFVLPFKIATTMLGCDFVFLRAKCAAFRFRQQPKADAENCTPLPCPSFQNRTRLSWAPVLCLS